MCNPSILLIDNYDSFTYNIVHYLEELETKVEVVKNDDPFLQQHNIPFQKTIISPGPGLPLEAGYLMQFLKNHYQTQSILGICLGQQAIAEFFGAKLTPLPEVQHGTSIHITQIHNDYIYRNIPLNFKVGLYHSWHTTDLPKQIIPTSKTSNGIIMSLQHCLYDIRAVQYHPESIMTPYGKQILKNWLNY